MAYLKSNDLFGILHPERIYELISRPIIIADHFLTPENMGSLIRLANNIGAQHLYFLGKAPTNSIGKLRKAAASSKNSTIWSFTEDDITTLIPRDVCLVAIETTDDASNIYETELPENIAFVLGNEGKGISEEILQRCSKKVYIPVPGQNCSLNVTHAASVAFFEWHRQMCLIKR